MQSIGDILQTIARQHGRGDTQPLLAMLTAPSIAGERIAHLPIDIELAQAWVALTAEPFRPHQAQALTALRRGEPVALRAANPDVAMTMHLLIYAALMASPAAVALLLAPDETAAQLIWSRLAQINQDLPRNLQFGTLLLGPDRRPDRAARLLIATPAGLHQRLLRHHDRAWQSFWAQLQLVALPDLQRYAGVAMAHLADLLMRLQRVAAGHAGGQVPTVLATLYDLADPEPVLANMLGTSWRVIAADDGPRAPTMLAVWRGGAWLRDSAELAQAMQRQGYQVHIACQTFERALLAPMIGDLPRITFGPDLAASQVLISAGYPGSQSAIWRMLRGGYQAVVLALGEQPHEQALARHAQSLLSAPPTQWVAPPANAYVLARHVLCAASEQPLTLAEVEAWGVQDIVDRLVAQAQLVDLPDPEIAWKPTDAAGDPYSEWSLSSSSGSALIARTEQAQVIGAIEPAIYDRWAFPQAALPIGASGFRILSRDEDTGALTLRFDSSGRRTYPLRRAQVQLREARDTRALNGGRSIGWGRVVVDEEIYGYREAAAGGAPADMALAPPLTARWAAPACWFDLPAAIQVQGQFIGWSLAAALPLRVLAEFTDVVPCYDHEAHRLYLVDAQPGGNGLSAWAYAHAEELLPLAYDLALACRADPLLEPLSRVDMDWLLALLGHQTIEKRELQPAQTEATRATPAPIEANRAAPPRVETPRRTEYLAGPPPPSAAAPDPAKLADQRPIPLWDAPKLPEAPPSAPAMPSAPAPAEPHRKSPVPPRAQHRKPEERATPRNRSFGDPPQAGAFPPKPPEQPPAPAREQPPVAQRQTPAKQPPADQPPAPPVRADDAPPDAAALIERLRRQREQREAQLGLSSRKLAAPPAGPVEQRFAAGDRVFCLPYGDGAVRESRIDNGRELLTIAFPEHGELTIDPLISLVRKIADAEPEEDDLL